MTTALVCYADGSEDIEVTAITDILNRGGVKVVKAAVAESGRTTVTLAHGSVITTDKNIADCTDTYDLIAIPGGLAGSEACRDCEILINKLKSQKNAGRYIGAICAAPGFVLSTHGLIGNARATGYPGCKTDTIINYCTDGVVTDSDARLVTGQGPAYALDFALALLEALEGKDVADKVAGSMLHSCAAK